MIELVEIRTPREIKEFWGRGYKISMKMTTKIEKRAAPRWKAPIGWYPYSPINSIRVTIRDNEAVKVGSLSRRK